MSNARSSYWISYQHINVVSFFWLSCKIKQKSANTIDWYCIMIVEQWFCVGWSFSDEVIKVFLKSRFIINTECHIFRFLSKEMNEAKIRIFFEKCSRLIFAKFYTIPLWPQQPFSLWIFSNRPPYHLTSDKLGFISQKGGRGERCWGFRQTGLQQYFSNPYTV